MKYWELEIDGTDKVGKDLLVKYLCILSNYKFSINCRGLMSQLVYSKKYNRDYKFNLETFNKNKIIIWLYGDIDDLEIRCKINNEPPYDIINDTKLFNEVYEMLSDKYIIFKYNTSTDTPYMIANDILNTIRTMEENNG